jgi:hypothetical protein
MGKGTWRFIRKEEYDNTHHICIYHVTYTSKEGRKTKMEYKLLLPKPYTKTWAIPKTHDGYLGTNMQLYKFGPSKRLTSKGIASKTEWKEGNIRFAQKPKKAKVTVRKPRRYW